MRYWWIGLVGILAACSGHSGPRPVSPVSIGSPLTGTAPGETSLSTVLDSLGIPDTSVGDTALLVADLNDERRQAADSAADEAVLEELADAHPEESPNDAGGEEAAEAVPGGANVTDAVTWDIDVATYNGHDRVQYYLDFFQDRGRERMNIWLTRLPRYEAMIRERLQGEGLPGDLVYLALIESGFSNTATSRAKAVGMWQFMKRTAKGYGLRVDSWVDERRDPYKATEAAVRHLADLNRRFGSLYLAAAAYNAGSGKVSRGIIRLPDEESDSVNSDATFFRLYDTKLLRRETKDYVPKLIAAALIAKQPRRYGFRVTPAEPAAYDSIVVPDMTGLDVIARLADTTVAAIRELNPQYLRLTTPPGTRSVVRLPAGRGEGTVASYAVLPPRQRVTFIEHFMAGGETLGHIARRYHVNQAMLLAANPKLNPRRVRIGQRVVVPTGGVPSTRVARRMAERVVAAGTSTSTFHRVRRGETISEIADEYGVTQRELRGWNNLDGIGRIRIGQKLRVVSPYATNPIPAQSGAVDARLRTHVVQRGETLEGLARRYGVSIQALRSANGLSGHATLRAGAALKIPS
ncbi:MAG TPA: LysM peptidoglycan-binding domain-containing protein [Gemmatimonadales bacterium]|nr:LysM peptidoglycan-binding domain-containing protein [Gemmatimonadales bacterium]